MDEWLVVIIATVALVVDAVTALLTYSLSKQSMNIRAAFLHNVADALGSIAVNVAGTLIIVLDWQWIDPLVTLLIAGYILRMSFSEVGPVIRILMLGSLPELEAKHILQEIEKRFGNIERKIDISRVGLSINDLSLLIPILVCILLK